MTPNRHGRDSVQAAWAVTRSYHFIVIASLFLAAMSPAAAQSFNMEADFAEKRPVPRDVLEMVSNEKAAEYALAGCLEPLDESFEATSARLGLTAKDALVVRPAHLCLCGVQTCDFWLFARDSQKHRYKLIGKIIAHGFHVDPKRSSHGLKNLQAYSGTAGHTYHGTYTFNGQFYVETEAKFWKAGP